MHATRASDVASLWARCAARPYVASPQHADPATLDPRDVAILRERAERALRREVDVLGSGPISLGTPIDWHRDHKTGVRWAPGYGPRISYLDPSSPSDVKMPWELSRLQWLIPLGQLYRVGGDERYAVASREILEEWFAENPYAMSINWAIAMEPALRLMTLTWLFHALHASEAWRAPAFRSRFMRGLYLHADFVERHIERSDVNGNHFTADVAGLVFAGLFFGDGDTPRRWADAGWRELEAELPRQVHPDGVDFEASTAYHRLVLELFFLPARYREQNGIATPQTYRDRLGAMARFTAAYTRPDGSAPVWGDADDGRALPLGTQRLNDHRYLVALVGAQWGDRELLDLAWGPRSEAEWVLGSDAVPPLAPEMRAPPSTAFREGGLYVMRGGNDHVLIDAGPVGMRGRGGHGHNDCLSFDAMLDGTSVAVDPGSYVYTASYEWRDRFRSTGYHNTLVVDAAEQNRYVGQLALWSLRDDARPIVSAWRPGRERDVLCASHTGYERLREPVHVSRTFMLDHAVHRLCVLDDPTGSGEHAFEIPIHLAAAARITDVDRAAVRFDIDGRAFALEWWSPAPWTPVIADEWISGSYGVRVPAPCVRLRRVGALVLVLVSIAPVASGSADLARVAAQMQAS